MSMNRSQFQSLFKEVGTGSGSLTLTAGTSQDITVTGAALGDFCLVSCSIDTADAVIDANVTAANTVSVMSTDADVGAATYKLVVLRTD